MEQLQRFCFSASKWGSIYLMLYSTYNDKWNEACAWGLLAIIMSIEIFFIECIRDDE
jgi:hypothetical protein